MCQRRPCSNLRCHEAGCHEDRYHAEGLHEHSRHGKGCYEEADPVDRLLEDGGKAGRPDDKEFYGNRQHDSAHEEISRRAGRFHCAVETACWRNPIRQSGVIGMTMTASNVGSFADALIFRHSALVRVTHWVNVLCLSFLLLSGLQIFNAHPALYWGQYGADHDPSFLSMGAVQNGSTLQGVTRIGPLAI